MAGTPLFQMRTKLVTLLRKKVVEDPQGNELFRIDQKLGSTLSLATLLLTGPRQSRPRCTPRSKTRRPARTPRSRSRATFSVSMPRLCSITRRGRWWAPFRASTGTTAAGAKTSRRWVTCGGGGGHWVRPDSPVLRDCGARDGPCAHDCVLYCL